MKSSTVVVISPDKFKGCLSAKEVAECLERGIQSTRPELRPKLAPVADGGDGTVDSAVAAGYDRKWAQVVGPTGGRRKPTSFALSGSRAVVELASSCGASTLPGGTLAPLDAHTVGLGQIILAAIECGCSDIVIGLGGSASTDGGTGMLSALGARFMDCRGDQVPPGARHLTRIRSISLAGLHPALHRTRLRIASDVSSTLLGESGSVATFGRQKGLRGQDARMVESGLTQLAGTVKEYAGVDIASIPGGGSAGGVAAVASALLGAELVHGATFVMNVLGIEKHISAARAVVTGEGSCDEQTLHGKAPMAIAQVARRHNVPVHVVAGAISLSVEGRRRLGARSWWSLLDAAGGDQAASITGSKQLLQSIGAELAKAL